MVDGALKETGIENTGIDSGELTTGVDELIALLKKHDKISVDDAAKELKVPKNVVSAWVEFLVEEKIVGIEYNFTTPFIYLNAHRENKVKAKKIKDPEIGLMTFKEEYFKKARENKIPELNIVNYWKKHLESKLKASQEYFIREAKKRNVPNPEQLWQKYFDKCLNT